jgi:hypothetical protein
MLKKMTSIILAFCFLFASSVIASPEQDGLIHTFELNEADDIILTAGEYGVRMQNGQVAIFEVMPEAAGEVDLAHLRSILETHGEEPDCSYTIFNVESAMEKPEVRPYATDNSGGKGTPYTYSTTFSNVKKHAARKCYASLPYGGDATLSVNASLEIRPELKGIIWQKFSIGGTLKISVSGSLHLKGPESSKYRTRKYYIAITYETGNWKQVRKQGDKTLATRTGTYRKTLKTMNYGVNYR